MTTEPISPFWISPEGERPDDAPGDAIARGWIQAVPGATVLLRMREGAVTQRAAVALRKALDHLPPDMPAEGGRGPGSLRDVLRRVQTGSWPADLTPDPREALAATRADLAKAEREAAIADWLREGLEAGHPPDAERFALALDAHRSACKRAYDALHAIPPELGDDAPAAGVPAAAEARIGRFEDFQRQLDEAWVGMAAACVGLRVDPPAPPPPPPETGDVLVDLRAAREARPAPSARGLATLWRHFPDGSPLPRALASAHARSGLGARYLANARRRIREGEEPRGVLSFYVQHECARHFSLARWMTEELEEAWAAAAPSPGPRR